VRHIASLALAAAALAACGTAPAEMETAAWQRCRSEARVHAASQLPGLPQGLAQATTLVREQAFLQQCLAPVLR
jgi:hypothetical protein